MTAAPPRWGDGGARGVGVPVGTSLDLSGQIQAALDSGELNVEVILQDVGSFTNDPYVGVTVVWRGVDSHFDGRIERGRVITRGSFLLAELPLNGGWLVLELREPRLRLTASPDAIRQGVTGGATPNDLLVEGLVTAAPDDIPESLARSIVEGQADREPTPGGFCEAISMAFVFEGHAL